MHIWFIQILTWFSDNPLHGQMDKRTDGWTDKSRPSDYSNPPPTLCGEGSNVTLYFKGKQLVQTPYILEISYTLGNTP